MNQVILLSFRAFDWCNHGFRQIIWKNYLYIVLDNEPSNFIFKMHYSISIVKGRKYFINILENSNKKQLRGMELSHMLEKAPNDVLFE